MDLGHQPKEEDLLPQSSKGLGLLPLDCHLFLEVRFAYKGFVIKHYAYFSFGFAAAAAGKSVLMSFKIGRISLEMEAVFILIVSDSVLCN